MIPCAVSMEYLWNCGKHGPAGCPPPHDTDVCGTLRTNLLDESDGLTAYVFENSSMTGAGAGTGLNYELAKNIMSVTNLTPARTQDRIYDMEVKVYAQDKIADGSPIITMTGTVTE